MFLGAHRKCFPQPEPKPGVRGEHDFSGSHRSAWDAKEEPAEKAEASAEGERGDTKLTRPEVKQGVLFF